jgi:hypothetical protein
MIYIYIANAALKVHKVMKGIESFLTHLFSGTTRYDKHYEVFYMRAISRPTPTQASKCGNTFTFATPFYIQLYNAIAVLANAGLQKRVNFFGKKC